MTSLIVKNNASLVVVGVGIKFLSHLTIEARSNIEQSDIVLYLVNEPAMKEWIKQANPSTESLDNIYFKHESRLEAYKAITDYILTRLESGLHVCVVLYGHPTVFAMPALDAVKIAKNRGYNTKILPGISAEDCLFADLLVDPGVNGYMSFEATDLLIYQRKIDPSCHLVIWQISVIGAQGHASEHDNSAGQAILTEYLLKYYNKEHLITIYVAALYPTFEPIINTVKLSDLANYNIPVIASLYIPPYKKAEYHLPTLKALGISRLTLGEK